MGNMFSSEMDVINDKGDVANLVKDLLRAKIISVDCHSQNSLH